MKDLLRWFSTIKFPFQGKKVTRRTNNKKLLEALSLLSLIRGIASDIKLVQERDINMALNLEALTAEVSRVKTVQESAIVLLKKLADEISANVDDPSALNQIVDDLKSSTDALAAAVATGTVSAPTKEVILNADNPAEATVKVILPEVLPEVVVATPEVVVDVVDTASPEPQVVVTVEAAPEATVEAVEAAPVEVVADPAQDLSTSEGDVVSDVIKTDEGQSDVVVTTPAEIHEEVKVESGVDAIEAVKEAFEAAPEVVAVPEAPAETPAE